GGTGPNAVVPGNWRWGGNANNQTYVGVDQAWFVGGSWSRPILNGGNISASPNNVFVDFGGAYTTFDNFELTNMANTPYGWPRNDHFLIEESAAYSVIRNMYIHGWNESGSYPNGNDVAVGFRFGTQTPPGQTGFVLESNVFDGSDIPSVQADPNCTGNCYGSGMAVYGRVPVARYNVFRQASNGFIGDAFDAHDNLVEFIRQGVYSGTHENGWENNGEPVGSWFYNNVIRHIHAGLAVWLSAQVGTTAHVFNNLIYDTPPNQANAFDIGRPLGPCTTPDSLGYCAGGNMVVWNNTVECGPDTNPQGQCGGCDSGQASSLGYHYASCLFQNNHYITSNTLPISGYG